MPQTKKTPKATAPPVIAKNLQQTLLKIFQAAFSETIASEHFSQVLQDVKGALYERDFDRAFGNEAYLEAYAARWSPSRALCYATIFADVRQAVDADLFNHDLTVVSLGGGAAETVGWGGYARHAGQTHFNLTLLDTAAWGSVVEKLSSALASPLPLSKYASAAARAANEPLLSAQDFTVRFEQKNVFDLTKPELTTLVGVGPTLITILFTLNELYSASLSKTTKLLLDLTAVAAPNTLLLVVDSPGSYSEAAVGKEKKRYPMQWLLQHTLLERESGKWERLLEDNSKWFRLDKDLTFPIPLEDMRYQIHLFRRC